MPLSVQIASDFVCPYCYVLEALLEDGKAYTQKQADAAIETFMKG